MHWRKNPNEHIWQKMKERTKTHFSQYFCCLVIIFGKCRFFFSLILSRSLSRHFWNLSYYYRWAINKALRHFSELLKECSKLYFDIVAVLPKVQWKIVISKSMSINTGQHSCSVSFEITMFSIVCGKWPQLGSYRVLSYLFGAALKRFQWYVNEATKRMPVERKRGSTMRMCGTKSTSNKADSNDINSNLIRIDTELQ